MRSLWYCQLGCASGVLLTPLTAAAATYYVAPTGSDANPGSITQPFATISQAQTVAAPGDTVYFRAGTYAYTAGIKTCASTTDTIDAILLDKSGTSGSPINYWGYPGETPNFDFSGIKDSCRIKGFDITGNWVYLKGLEVQGVPQNNTDNHESWGIWDSGSYNTFELINAHNNMGPGLFIQAGGNNLVLNCDSHENYDPYSSNGAGNNADGFGCHSTTTGTAGMNNVFRGCRAWWNSDDGYDFIQAQEPVTVEDSWSWYNGYLPDTTNSCANCNGNGFKGGGYNIPPYDVPASPPSHTYTNCLAFLNSAAGFYANHEPVGDHFYNDTSYMNGADFNLLGMDYTGPAEQPSTVVIPASDYVAQDLGTLRNNIAFGGTLLTNATGPLVDASYNSWDIAGLTVTAADFQSTSITGMDGPRQADGSLPCVPFMRLAAGSGLIGKGTNVGLPYTGVAPDLGAFPYGPCTSTSADAGATGESDSGSESDAGLSTGSSSGSTGGASSSGSSTSSGASSGSTGGTTSGSSSGSDGGAGETQTSAAGDQTSKAGCGCESVGENNSPSRDAVASVGLVLAALGLTRRRRVHQRLSSRVIDLD